jgi:metal-sulfur cluster biosynthetic enzyme
VGKCSYESATVAAAGSPLGALLHGLKSVATFTAHFDQISAMHAHAHLGAVGVFVMLIVGISYKLVPMFTFSDCSIVDLGLIYGTQIDGRKVTVQMTLTTQGCPMHESIARGVKNALVSLEAVEDAEVQIVWDPPWHPSMMTDQGRARVGVRS